MSHVPLHATTYYVDVPDEEAARPLEDPQPVAARHLKVLEHLAMAELSAAH